MSDRSIQDRKYKAAYLAGYFDADGSVGARVIHRTDYNYNTVEIKTTVSGRNVEFLECLQRQYGGTFSCSEGVWNWRLSGSHTTRFLEKIIPYLDLKRRRAELALRIARSLGEKGQRVSIGNKQRRWRWALEICELNQAGLANPRVTDTMKRIRFLLGAGEQLALWKDELEMSDADTPEQLKAILRVPDATD